MKKLKIDSTNKVVFGVCSGIANYYDIDPTWVRAGVAIAALLSCFGTICIIYIVLALIMSM